MPSIKNNISRWIRSLKFLGHEAQAKSALETIENPANDFISSHERLLLSNILKLRELRVVNIMVPRANIVAVEENTTPQELLNLLAERQFSRFPVYRETLDNVIGTIHVKDVVAALARGEQPMIAKMITDVPIVSPAMSILNLLLKMRQMSRHVALVVDEYGGIDGLVTIGNIIESIIGEIDDEHAEEERPRIVVKDDGSVIVDASLNIVAFEDRFGTIFSDEERDSSDTLSGLVISMAGRIPARGEILTHTPTGMVFEILDADPRRINLIRVQHVPSRSE
ncbi:MAG: hemolysin family protein [Alphaproteobacteria bacterium]